MEEKRGGEREKSRKREGGGRRVLTVAAPFTCTDLLAVVGGAVSRSIGGARVSFCSSGTLCSLWDTPKKSLPQSPDSYPLRRGHYPRTSVGLIENLNSVHFSQPYKRILKYVFHKINRIIKWLSHDERRTLQGLVIIHPGSR